MVQKYYSANSGKDQDYDHLICNFFYLIQNSGEDIHSFSLSKVYKDGM